MLLGSGRGCDAERVSNPSRDAANVLLDALSAFDPEASGNNEAIKLALRRLEDVGAITATYDDEEDVLTLDADPLLMGTLSLLVTLTELIAQDRSMDRRVLIHTLRDQLQTTLPD